MSSPHLYRFGFTPLNGSHSQVDREHGVIRGVSLITSGVKARGHDLEVDHTTLSQMLDCAKLKGQVPVKLNHQSGVENVCGFMTNFRIQDTKLLGDWHLLASHPETQATLEKAERMPSCFGLSGAFMGTPETIKGTERGAKPRKMARCTELLAVDCVTQPAANPDGLFSAREQDDWNRVDSQSHDNMANDQSQNTGAPMDQILAALQETNSNISALGERLGSLEAHVAQQAEEAQNYEGDEEGGVTAEQLQALGGMSDAELGALGLTRADVHAAMAEVGMTGDGDEAGDGSGSGMEGAVAAGEGGAVAASLQRQINGVVNHLEAGVRAQEEAQLENAFGAIEGKVIELSEALANARAENEALRHAFKTGEVRPLGSGAESHQLFSADDNAPRYQQRVTAKMHEFMQGGMNEIKARSEAVKFCIKNHPQEYAEFRANPQGVTRL